MYFLVLDLDSVRFPKVPIEISDAFKKIVKVKSSRGVINVYLFSIDRIRKMLNIFHGSLNFE